MAYLVTRTVNGRQYRYLQRSFRDSSGKIRTETVEYLGAVSPCDGSIRSLDKITTPATAGRSNEAGLPRRASSASIHRILASRGLNLVPRVTAETSDLFHKRTDFKRLRIDANRLIQESRQFVAVLQSKAAEANGVIRIKWGSELASRRKHKNIIISCPNRIAPGALRTEIHKAHARLAISALKEAQPEAFHDLSLQAQTSFLISKQIYAEAILQGKDWRRKFKAIGVERFGNFQNLKENFRDPRKWGFYHYEQKRTWEDEMVSLYAEAQSQGGLYSFAKALRREEQLALRAARFLESKRTDKKDRKLEPDIYRANLRASILAENCRKLPHLNALFYANYGVFDRKEVSE